MDYKESYITGQYKRSALAHIHGENRSCPFANSTRLFRLILAKGHSREKNLSPTRREEERIKRWCKGEEKLTGLARYSKLTSTAC